MWTSIEELQDALLRRAYVADRGLATAIHLSCNLERPLFLEGDAGVGKTSVAVALAEVLDAPLLRLQCYEGIGIEQALYDWNHARQLLTVRTAESNDEKVAVDDLFSEEFLIERPILAALRSPRRAILLIDEIDRADDEFEAFLLEVLNDHALTIPEIGTISAVAPPIVVLTSNRTRDVHDALKRRCYYHFIDHPDPETELRIVSLRVPGTSEDLARQVTSAIAKLRALAMIKPPGVAETIDWVRALTIIGATSLTTATAADTLGSAVKNEEDLALANAALQDIVHG